MVTEEAGVGAARDQRVRGGRRQKEPRGRRRSRDLRDLQTGTRLKRRHTENEPPKVRQTGGHGRPHLSQRGLSLTQR